MEEQNWLNGLRPDDMEHMTRRERRPYTVPSEETRKEVRQIVCDMNAAVSRQGAHYLDPKTGIADVRDAFRLWKAEGSISFENGFEVEAFFCAYIKAHPDMGDGCHHYIIETADERHKVINALRALRVFGLEAARGHCGSQFAAALKPYNPRLAKTAPAPGEEGFPEYLLNCSINHEMMARAILRHHNEGGNTEPPEGLRVDEPLVIRGSRGEILSVVRRAVTTMAHALCADAGELGVPADALLWSAASGSTRIHTFNPVAGLRVISHFYEFWLSIGSPTFEFTDEVQMFIFAGLARLTGLSSSQHIADEAWERMLEAYEFMQDFGTFVSHGEPISQFGHAMEMFDEPDMSYIDSDRAAFTSFVRDQARLFDGFLQGGSGDPDTFVDILLSPSHLHASSENRPLRKLTWRHEGPEGSTA